jgi:hypothetical protein
MVFKISSQWSHFFQKEVSGQSVVILSHLQSSFRGRMAAEHVVALSAASVIFPTMCKTESKGTSIQRGICRRRMHILKADILDTAILAMLTTA